MSAEKRRHSRLPVDDQALIVAPGRAPVGCRLVNVCAGGLWVSDLGSETLRRTLRRQLGEGGQPLIEVHVFSRLAGREQHFRMLAQVLRMSAEGMGLRFLASQEDLVKALTQRSGGGIATAGGYLPPTVRQQAFDAFVEQAAQAIESLLQSSFAPLRVEAGPAIGLAQNASRPLDPGLAARWIGIFLALWRERVEALRRPSDRRREEALELIDHQHFERWLELQQVAARITDSSREALFALNQLLAQLLSRTVEDRDNPLSPYLLCHVFNDLYRREDLETWVGAEGLRQFATSLRSALPSLLQQVQQPMASLGLSAVPLAAMRDHWPSTSDRHDPPVERSESSAVAGMDVDPGSPGTLAESRSGVLRFLQASTAVAGDPAATAPDGPTLQRQQHALKVLLDQSREALLADSAPVDRSTEVLFREAAEAHGLELGPLARPLQDRFRIVDQVLDVPRDWDPEARRLLERLRLPLAEALIDDARFLEDPQHPLRQVVNRFCRLAGRDGLQSRQTRQLLETVAGQLAAAPLGEPELEALAGQLEQGLQRQQRALEHTAERISRKYDGQDRLQRARLIVGQRLDALFDGTKVPLILLQLLDAGLQHLLVLEALKSSEDTVELARRLQRLQALNRFITDIALDRLDSVDNIEQRAAEVLEATRRALKDSHLPIEARAALDELAALFADPALIEFVPWLSRLPEIDTPVSPDLATTAERWLTRVASLQPGQWLEWREPGQAPRRLRLVWSDEQAYRFVFLAEQSLQEMQLAQDALVQAFQQGRLILVDGDAVEWVDQSLFQLVEDLYRKMAWQSLHDPLTGCLQRHELEKHLNCVLMRCRTERQGGALLWIDIDQFRVINGNYGPAAGDQILRQVGALLAPWAARPEGEGVLGRMGSNEFGLLLHPLEPAAALDLADQIAQACAQHLFRLESSSIRLTVRIGVVALDADSRSSGDVLNQAVLAAEVGKQKGGNHVHLYRVSDKDQMHQQQMLEWVHRIDRYLAEDRLGLRVQRIAPVEPDGALPKFEVLLDLPEEDGRRTSPQVFIESAERFRRAVQVDRWVVGKVFAWMRSHPKELETVGALAINLSGHSMSDDEFLFFLENEFRQGGFPADKVCFELTETAAVGSLHYTADLIRALKHYRCRFALDDFGTGFSSYAYLQSLPVDYLKIDGVFIRRIATDLTSYAMVKSITELGHYLGIEVIAECVEDEAALEALTEIGVQWLQGWHIAHPIALSSWEIKLKNFE